MVRRAVNVFLSALAVIGLMVLYSSLINPISAQTDHRRDSEIASSICPKCKGTMEIGIIRDYWNVNSFEPTSWSPGHQKQHIFSQGKKVQIIVYRCTNCGYLESYAK